MSITVRFHTRQTKTYAIRYWPAVPAVGDVVMLHDPERDRQMRYPAVVRLVVWGRSGSMGANESVEVEAYVEWQDEVSIPWSDTHLASSPKAQLPAS